jgi:hypothetical protein
MMSMNRTAIAAALVLIASTAQAQGTLSSQGFGYPSGGVSTRARATGGSMAEFDGTSTVNPASIGELGRASLYIQYEPEFRTLTGPDGKDRSTVIRFPLFAGALPAGSGWMVGLSASSLLDRSWATRARGEQVFEGRPVGYTDIFQSLGSITDVRLSGARLVGANLRVGIGLHAITGQNRLVATRTFDSDQVTFAPFGQATAVTYTGSAISAGATWRVTRNFGLAASERRGGSLTASVLDTTIGRGRVPDRAGASARLQIATGTQVFARADRVWWSRLNPLSVDGGAGFAIGRDGWEVGGGIEGRGPVLFSRPVSLRLGGDRRTLPFLANGSEVNELRFAGGFGMPLAFGRSTFDATLQHATRDAGLAISEKAWTLSIGLTVRP